MTDSFLPPVRDVLPYHRRHTPPLQSGIGSASHATEVASALFQRITSLPGPCGILWILACHKPGPDDFRFIALPRASIPESAAYCTTPRPLPQIGQCLRKTIRFPVLSIALSIAFLI